jgi:hypothetical protein
MDEENFDLNINKQGGMMLKRYDRVNTLKNIYF